MMSYRDHFERHLRLALLRVLTEATGYAANSLVLALAVKELGFAAPADQIRAQLLWLDEQRLVALVRSVNGPWVATLTERGSDVAKGLTENPGVERPVPEA